MVSPIPLLFFFVGVVSSFGGMHHEDCPSDTLHGGPCAAFATAESCEKDTQCVWDVEYAVACQPKEHSTVTITILHFNDVYEVAGVAGGTKGGLPRVAGLKENLEKEKSNVFCLFAGDMISPSAINRAKILDDNFQLAPEDATPSERLSGVQMLNVSNLFVDVAVFGNHEFDYDGDAFFKIMKHSKFPWLASNVEFTEPVEVHSQYEIFTASENGHDIKFAVVGIVLDSNDPDYTSIDNFHKSVTDLKELVRKLKHEEGCDVVIGLTHLSYNKDLELARFIPEIDVVMGGHDHLQIEANARAAASVFKADGNAITTYVHDLIFDVTTKSTIIYSMLTEMDETVSVSKEAEDQAEFWLSKALDPTDREPFAMLTEAFDARELTVRFSKESLVKDILTDSLLDSDAGKADVAIFNSGSLRIDDFVNEGPFTKYDLMRLLPFGGTHCLYEISGADLEKFFIEAHDYPGCGCFMHYSTNVAESAEGWMINGVALDTGKTYTVGSGSYLAAVGDQNFKWLADSMTQVGDTCGDLWDTYAASVKSAYPL